jgi:hypothetical protein
MSSALHTSLFSKLSEITCDARAAASRHIQPLLRGEHLGGENDTILIDLYQVWQAAARAAAAALKRDLYPNESAEMPEMPVDDEGHQSCRQMAAVLIERNLYGEHTGGSWFDEAADAIKKNPSCADHPACCACKKALEGWTSTASRMQVQLLEAFYKAHSSYNDEEGDYWREDYKCTFCGSMASECGEDHGDEMRDIMREHRKHRY